MRPGNGAAGTPTLGRARPRQQGADTINRWVPLSRSETRTMRGRSASGESPSLGGYTAAAGRPCAHPRRPRCSSAYSMDGRRAGVSAATVRGRGVACLRCSFLRYCEGGGAGRESVRRLAAAAATPPQAATDALAWRSGLARLNHQGAGSGQRRRLQEPQHGEGADGGNCSPSASSAGCRWTTWRRMARRCASPARARATASPMWPIRRCARHSPVW